MFDNPLKAFFFFFNDTATTEIYTLSLHDALPISRSTGESRQGQQQPSTRCDQPDSADSGQVLGAAENLTRIGDRKSTRLNSSHLVISYAVFCLKKKKIQISRMITFYSRSRALRLQ